MIVSASTMWIVRFGLSYVFVKFLGLGVAAFGMECDRLDQPMRFFYRPLSQRKVENKGVIR
jgi:Na+-driven multidrug efflux pump